VTFLDAPNMGEQLGQVPAHLLDRIQANTDPLQKGEALCRVFAQLRNELTVRVGEIKRDARLSIVALFLWAFNPPGLFSTFIYLSEFLFSHISRLASSNDGEHELKGLQIQLEFFFDQALPVPLKHGTYSIDIFRLIRTKQQLWRVALFAAPNDQAFTTDLEMKTVVKAWTGLDELDEGDIFVHEFPVRDSKFRSSRVTVHCFSEPPITPPTEKFNEIFVIHRGVTAETVKLIVTLRKLFAIEDTKHAKVLTFNPVPALNEVATIKIWGDNWSHISCEFFSQPNH
jgi:hypothetical protein